MQHNPIDEVARRAVRAVACTQCYQRPAGSEALGPEVPRACEATCPLFLHLPTLVRLAPGLTAEPGAVDRALQASVCRTCRLSLTAGEYCAEFAARACPLSRYGSDVLTALARAASAASDDPHGRAVPMT